MHVRDYEFPSYLHPVAAALGLPPQWNHFDLKPVSVAPQAAPSSRDAGVLFTQFSFDGTYGGLSGGIYRDRHVRFAFPALVVHYRGELATLALPAKNQAMPLDYSDRDWRDALPPTGTPLSYEDFIAAWPDKPYIRGFRKVFAQAFGIPLVESTAAA